MILRLCYSLLLLGAVIGCNGIPYRIDIDQGNLIDAKTLEKIRIGMSKTDVQETIGTPLLTDVFNTNRWYYVQYYKAGKNQNVQKNHIALLFTDGLLSAIEKGPLSTIKTDALPYGDGLK